jgi:riboflavin-specific deaminase-like protein
MNTVDRPSRPPRNPFLSAEKYALTHFDPAQSDAFDAPVPRGVFRIDPRESPQVIKGPINIMTLVSTSPDFVWAVRDVEVTRQPVRIVVDSNARTPASARVLDDAAPTVIAVADDADASHLEGRAELVRLPRVDAGLDLDLLLKALSERGVRAILLEGGPTLAGSLLAAGLIDRVVAYIAPVLIGGGGKSALAGPGAPNIADAKRFRLEDVVRIGADVRLTATPLS